MRERGPEDDYSFIRSVGKGSYGEVSLAWHRTEGKQYVIKKLSLQNAPRRERKAAEQEAQLLSRLKHPNIVAYKESWEGEDGLLYIVMGFCEGGDLYHKLKEQKGKLLPESQVMDWFIQIAMALQYLHDERIMHRDLKTQNIFLTRSNIIKVGDLGIARVLETQYDMASTLIGTPYYMSPELFANKPYNFKSDVWALGCCVYEMATLRHAFNAKDMNSLVYRIIEGKLPAMPKDYSPELGELMGAMLSRQPEKRPSVKQILRKPFIKHHIALFLQATKLNHGKRRKKVPDTIPIKDHANTEPKDPLKPASDLPKQQRMNKVKSPVKRKTLVASSDIPNTSASPAVPDPRASPAIPNPCASPSIPGPRASPTVPDPRASPAIPDPRASPAIPDPRASPDIPDPRASPVIPGPSASPAIPDPRGPRASPDIPDPRASPSIPDPRASPAIPDPRASPAIPDPRASPAIPDPRASPAIPDPRASPAIPDPRASPAIPDARAITHFMDQHASSALPQQISLCSIPEISQNCLNHTGVSIATLSNVDINILSTEKNKPSQSHLIPSEEAQRGGFVNETECKMKRCTSHLKDAQETPHLIYPVAKRSTKTAHSMEDGDDTMKQPVTNDGGIIIQNETSPNPSEDAQIPLCTILQPHNSVSEPSVSRQRRHKNKDEGSADSQKLDRVCSRPLPSPPATIHRTLKTAHSNPETWRSGTSGSGNQSSTRDALPAQDPRPLSARERRRLKQSQEEIFPTAPAVRRVSAISVDTDGRNLDIIQPSPINRLSADSVLSARKEPLTRQVSEDELSSSTSSTDKSEEDSKEGRCDSSEMQDLVQLMTQTLHMEKEAGEKQQKPACEFRLHRKYRDTLLLHGKAQEEEPEQICLQEFHADHLTVPEKFRRMVEALRADVVQELGVKLLEKVYDDLEEEDESERELRLKRHLGHRYSNFSLKIRQLKFFEENSTF